jgi:histidine triad (HIT) family protein
MADQQQYTPEQMAEIKKKLENMSPEEIQEMVKQQCIFCKILAGEIPAHKVYEDSKVLAFLDIKPANLGHVLLIPKKHYSVLPQMPDDEVCYLFAVAKQLSGVIFDTVGAEGVEIRQRNGQVAGQLVPHVHVHIIPRYQNDNVPTDWNPKEFSEAELKKVTTDLATKAKSIKVVEPKTKIVEKIVQAPMQQIPQAPQGAKPTKSKAPKVKKPKIPKRKKNP